eukprot:scaffold306719_cov33-Tisochrysis_lutea.AAC.5
MRSELKRAIRTDASAARDAPMAVESPGNAPAERNPWDEKVVGGAMEAAVGPARPEDFDVAWAEA